MRGWKLRCYTSVSWGRKCSYFLLKGWPSKAVLELGSTRRHRRDIFHSFWEKSHKTLWYDESLNSPWQLFSAVMCFVAGNPWTFQVRCLCCTNAITWKPVWWSGKPLTDLKIVVQVPGGPQHPHGGINKKQDEALIDCVSRWRSCATKEVHLKKELRPQNQGEPH